ncbi:TlpA family protein disulfide reductase [Carnimonas nigrificans]|uniref:TlpA family protein disulfide reductase n=1 Tax=Carnimonas nigrificans TaxID=64323 RepID=UPI0004700C3E|nr:hypothetical protein [Carnimonas nigrificans]
MANTFCWGLLALPLSGIYTAQALLPLAFITPASARIKLIGTLLCAFTSDWLPVAASSVISYGALGAVVVIMMVMKARRYLLWVACSIAIWLFCKTLDPLATTLPTTLPAVPFETLAGHPAPLTAPSASPRLLLLWQSSNKASTQQLALLQQCRHSLAPLVLIAINQGDQLLALLSAVKATTSSESASSTPLVTQLRDRHQQLGNALGIRHLPLIVLLDRNGQIVAASTEKLGCTGLRRLVDKHRDIFKDDDVP